MIFKIISIIVLIVFYGCYFAKMISQRQKGIQTDHMGKGKNGAIKAIEILLKVSAFLIVAVEIISILFIKTSAPLFIRFPGIPFAAVGVLVFVLSVLHMKDNWRVGVSEGEKTELVTSGIYSISRNPAFLGFDLVYIGILLMFFNWILFAVTIFSTTMMHLQIVNVEEEFLSLAFGDEYLNYRTKVNRYIGKKVRSMK